MKISSESASEAKKTHAFPHNFCSIFRRFWAGFGVSWGGFGKHMAVQNGSLKRNVIFFDKISIFKGFWDGLGRVLGEILEGFGRDLGRFGMILKDMRALWARKPGGNID